MSIPKHRQWDSLKGMTLVHKGKPTSFVRAELSRALLGALGAWCGEEQSAVTVGA